MELNIANKIVFCLIFFFEQIKVYCRANKENEWLMLKKTQTTQSVFNDIRKWLLCHFIGFPGGSDDEEYAYNAGDLGLIPGSGRSPGEGHGNPLQYSCLENPMDRGAWQAAVHGVTELNVME